MRTGRGAAAAAAEAAASLPCGRCHVTRRRCRAVPQRRAPPRNGMRTSSQTPPTLTGQRSTAPITGSPLACLQANGPVRARRSCTRRCDGGGERALLSARPSCWPCWAARPCSYCAVAGGRCRRRNFDARPEGFGGWGREVVIIPRVVPLVPRRAHTLAAQCRNSSRLSETRGGKKK